MTEPHASPTSPEELIASVRALARRGRIGEARSLARDARGKPGSIDAGHAAGAVIAVEYGRFEAAWRRLGKVSRETALRLVPAEVVATELATDHAAGVASAARILDAAAEPSPETTLDLARHLFARDELELTERALRRLEASTVSAGDPVAAEARWLERWLERRRTTSVPQPVGDGQVPFAVVDYKLPDYRRTSANVGDYIQTLASLGHVARHEGVRVSGEPGLVAELDRLRERVPRDLRVSGGARELVAVPVDRDASSLGAVPEGTWMLAFGWYMHAWFRVRYDFPFHPHLLPLFVSFHLSRPQLLSEQGVAYLRRHAPIGCRDWPTVRRLTELGIPAFFSGCLTTTVDLLFGDAPRTPAEAPVALVDVAESRAAPDGHSTTTLRHASREIREAELPANLDRALRTLSAYRSDYSRIVTSRLHCYLPARALGADVEFRPRRDDDPRFEGLIGIDEESFEAMRRGIGAKLETVFGSILRGEEEAAVRATWAELCESDVRSAQARTI